MDILLVTAGILYQNVVNTNTIQAEAAEMFHQTCHNVVDMFVVELLDESNGFILIGAVVLVGPTSRLSPWSCTRQADLNT